MSDPAVTVARVTGAAGGVGRQVAADLASRGWSVLVPGRSADAARCLADDLAGFGDVRALETDLDVTDPAAVEAVPPAVRAATGRLDVLVNNTAAFAFWSELSSSSGVADVRVVMEANHFGPRRLTQALLPVTFRWAETSVGEWNSLSSGAEPPGWRCPDDEGRG